jgi:cephalosporin hydroxylase
MATHELGDQEIIDAFHRLWYEGRARQTWRNTTWLGHELQQCPTDLWVYQELLARLRPDVVVEAGVKRGGTTHYLASICDLLGHGEVIGIDISIKKSGPAVGGHRRITLIEGSSTDQRTFDQVAKRCRGKSVLVLLDSDHSEAHVRAELDLYSTLVQPGGYVIVNDTNIGGHPVLEAKESSPWDAVQTFLADHPEWEVDQECEKHMLTQCPQGYLRRVR